MSTEIYRQEGSSFRSVGVDLLDDEFVIDTQDMGELTEAMWGDTDYEFWTSVHRDHRGALIIALVKEFLAGDPTATDRLRAICQKHGVPHKWDSWI